VEWGVLSCGGRDIVAFSVVANEEKRSHRKQVH